MIPSKIMVKRHWIFLWLCAELRSRSIELHIDLNFGSGKFAPLDIVWHEIELISFNMNSTLIHVKSQISSLPWQSNFGCKSHLSKCSQSVVLIPIICNISTSDISNLMPDTHALIFSDDTSYIHLKTDGSQLTISISHGNSVPST